MEKEKSSEKKLKRTVDPISRGGGQRGTGPELEYQVVLRAFPKPPQTTEFEEKRKAGRRGGGKKSETRCQKCRPVFKSVFVLRSLTYLTGRRGQSRERKCLEGSRQRK